MARAPLRALSRDGTALLCLIGFASTVCVGAFGPLICGFLGEPCTPAFIVLVGAGAFAVAAGLMRR